MDSPLFSKWEYEHFTNIQESVHKGMPEGDTSPSMQILFHLLLHHFSCKLNGSCKQNSFHDGEKAAQIYAKANGKPKSKIPDHFASLAFQLKHNFIADP